MREREREREREGRSRERESSLSHLPFSISFPSSPLPSLPLPPPPGMGRTSHGRACKKKLQKKGGEILKIGFGMGEWGGKEESGGVGRRKKREGAMDVSLKKSCFWQSVLPFSFIL